MFALTGVSGNRVFWSLNANDSVGCLSGRFSGTTGWQSVNRSQRMEGHELSAPYRPFHPQDLQLGAAETLGVHHLVCMPVRKSCAALLPDQR